MRRAFPFAVGVQGGRGVREDRGRERSRERLARQRLLQRLRRQLLLGAAHRDQGRPGLQVHRQGAPGRRGQDQVMGEGSHRASLDLISEGFP